MSGTILQSLSTRQSGLLLFESFESPNFMIDQGWSLIHGTPAISDNVAKESLSSFIMDSSYPSISKKFSVPFSYSSVWFYDDATQTASTFKPFVVWTLSGTAQFWSLGVDNATSTGFYTVDTTTSGSAATSAARVTGWHRMTTMLTGGVQTLLIDNVVVYTEGGTVAAPDTIGLGAQNYTSTAFGYFDWAQVMLLPVITMYGLTDPQFLNVVLSSGGTVIQSQAASSGGIATVDVSTIDFPAQGFMQVQQAPFGDVLFYQSDVLSTLNAGDIYFLNLYRFNRRPSTLSVMPMESRNYIKAVGGPKQSVFFFDQDSITVTFRGLTESEKNLLLRWWNTAKRGETFSLAINEDDIFLDFTQFPAGVAYPNGELILSSPATQPGQILTVQTNDGLIKENVKVKSVALSPTTGFYTATLELPQTEAVAAGLQVRALYYWPFAVTTAKSLSVSLESVQIKRWTATLSFEELIQSPSWIEFLNLKP